MLIVGEKNSKYSADKDQQFSLNEYGLNILIPAEVITPVESMYDVTAKGLWGGSFECPDGCKLVSGLYYISISSSSKLKKPVTVQLEHCAHIIDEDQTQYLSFVVAKFGPPYIFKYLRGGSFSPGSQYGTIDLQEFSILAIVLITTSAIGGAVGAPFGLVGAAAGAVVGGAIGYYYRTC